MKTYIIGSGGVGGYFGGLLAKAGNDVTFLARNEHFDQISKSGLQVKNVEEDFVVNPAKVIRSIDEMDNPDFIFFAVKTFDSVGIAKELDKVTSDKTTIITFQNGINNDEILSQNISKGKVYPGLAFVISTKTNPGIINQTGGFRKLIFGNRSRTCIKELHHIEQMMKESGIDATYSDNITRDLWRKYIFINAFSGMTAICRSNIGKVRDDAVAFSLYEDCVKESISVAKKMKIDLPDSIFEDVIKISTSTASDSKSSLLHDIENNRNNEIEVLNGTLVKLAEKYDVDVPINKMIYGAIKLLSG